MNMNIVEHVKEKADYIYQRIRTQINRLESSSASEPSVFFVFGASVCLSFFSKH